MNYGKAIFNILSNDSNVTNIVSGRIYPTRAFNNAALPYVVYSQISNEPQNEKGRAATVDIATYQVSCFAKDYSQAVDLADAVRKALEKQSGTFNGVDVEDIVVEGSNEVFDEDQGVHHIPIDFGLFIKR